MANPIRQQFSGPTTGGGGFNALAAGRKSYGGGRPMPTSGKVTDKKGYGLRDAKAKARREALLKRASSVPGQASSKPGRVAG